MMLADQCPDQRHLLALLNGQLPADLVSKLERHLCECSICEQQLERLTAIPSELQFLTELTSESSGNSWTGEGEPQRGGQPAESNLCDSADQTDSEDGISAPSRDGAKLPFEFGPYLAIEELASGSSGTLYKGWDRIHECDVALKVLHPWLRGDEQARARMQREAKAAARVRHPSVVEVKELFTHTDGTLVLVMELLSPQTLDELIQDDGGSVDSSLISLIADAADGLAALHENELVHRDIKPKNLLIDSSGDQLRVVVGDLGLVRDHDSQASLTNDARLVGTPAYISPEQVRDAGKADQRSDVYSLGCVLYKLITGVVPFEGSARMVIWQAAHGTVRAPSQLNESVDHRLEAVCLKATSRRPQDRYQSASEFAADLRRYLGGKSVLARRPGPVAQLMRWCERHPIPAVSISVTMLVLMATAIGAVVVGRELAIARDREVEARQVAEENERIALKQRQALLRTLVSVSEDVAVELEELPGSMGVRRRLLNTALGGLQDRTLDVLGQQDVSLAVANTSLMIGELILQAGRTPGELPESHRLGTEAADVSTRAAARRMFQQSLNVAEQCLEKEDDVSAVTLAIVDARHRIGELDYNDGKSSLVAEVFRQTEAICERCIAQEKAQRKLAFQHRLYVSRCWQSSIHESEGDLEAALYDRARALDVAIEIADHYPFVETIYNVLPQFVSKEVLEQLPSGKDLTAVRSLFYCSKMNARLQLSLGLQEEALENLRLAQEVGESLISGRDRMEQTPWQLSSIYRELSWVDWELGDQSSAMQRLDAAIELLASVKKEAPSDIRTLLEISSIRYRQAFIVEQLGGDAKDWEVHLRQALQAVVSAEELLTDSRSIAEKQMSIRLDLGKTLLKRQAFSEAREVVQRGLEIADSVFGKAGSTESIDSLRQDLRKIHEAAE